MLVALPPAPPPNPPIAVCVRLSVPLVAPPIASFTPPLLIRLTDAPLPLAIGEPPRGALPPIAVPDTVTVPPVTELPKTAGPRAPLDKVALPPRPWLKPLPRLTPASPPLAVAEIVTWSRAIPVAWAFALPPLPAAELPDVAPQPWPQPLPPAPPVAVEKTDALGTLI